MIKNWVLTVLGGSLGSVFGAAGQRAVAHQHAELAGHFPGQCRCCVNRPNLDSRFVIGSIAYSGLRTPPPTVLATDHRVFWPIPDFRVVIHALEQRSDMKSRRTGSSPRSAAVKPRCARRKIITIVHKLQLPVRRHKCTRPPPPPHSKNLLIPPS